MNANTSVEKFWKTTQQLLQKTKAGEAAWQVDPEHQDSYVLRLPKSVVAISSRPVNPSPAGCVLELRDVWNRTIGCWSVPSRLDADFQLLWELFEEASRAASPSEAIEDVAAALNSEGSIG